METNHRRSSDVLKKLVQNKNLNGDLSYQCILEQLGERAFGLVLMFFALPSALPFSAIPGISFIFSVPIAITALQMILGRKTLWLPQFIAKRKISHEKICKIINKALPSLIKIERLLKPRLPFMTSRIMEIINGIVILCLSLLLMLPIPFSNFILAGLIIIFSFGLVAKDGLFILIAYLGALLYITMIYFFIGMAIQTIFKRFI